MGVGPTQCAKEKRVSKNGQFCSQPAGLAFPTCKTDNLRTVFFQAWPLATCTRIT